MKFPKGVHPLQRELLNYANKVVAEVNGKKVTGFDKAHLILRNHMEKSPETAKKLLEMYSAASDADHEFRLAVVAEALHHKEKHQSAFDLARRLGRPLPAIYPAPDDIVIGPNLSVRFLGPVTAADTADWDFFRRGRETFIFVAHEIMELSGAAYSIEEGYERYMKLRRKYYRVNRHLPDAFKRRHPQQFPPFDPRRNAGMKDED